ncbi:sodium/potassium-transporting ATPase subunit beta-1-like isoform X1 [Chironomus tepperi]|uniref:sodium/potassium-transporting ATPase subunit beta-1-like isoform X1 n=1 Tax=Chironomus tepperi TaxID=113505 RepID=UPI00391F545E
MSAGQQNQTGESVPLKLFKRQKSRGSDLVTTTYEFPYMKKPEQKSFGKLLYDREQGKVFGRTPKNWGQLIFFYSIFYAGLSALFAICLKGLLSTMDQTSPKWKLGESLIGTNPGLGFRPIAHDVDQGSLIWYDSSNETQVDYWIEQVDKFLNESTKSLGKQKICDFGNPPNGNQVCKLDTTKFGECIKENKYGYDKASPCIFLKLNRIYGWEPEYFNDPADLPADMPESLKAHIGQLNATQRNQVWVSCEGEEGMDKELLGPTEYYPKQGFPSYFYPYTNKRGYVSPLVAVKFLRPSVNQIINIECRAWAKNIVYSGSHRDRKGSVHFELMIDADV